MSIFSLQEVTELQIQNIIDDDFRSWPEDNLRSYHDLGSDSIDFLSNITTFDYSTETELYTTLTYPGDGSRSIISNATNHYGYFSGGAYSNGRKDITRRLEFSTNTISLPGNNMPMEISHGGSIDTHSYGYCMGGYTPSLEVSNILRLDFSTEQWTDLAPNSTSEEQDNKGVVGNDENAYLNGGGNSNTRDKFDLAIEEISSLPNYPVSGSYQNGVSNKSYGYIAGGNNGGTYYSSILRTDFSNDTVYNTDNPIVGQRAYINSFGNFSFGYFANGQSGASTLHSNIFRLDLGSETVSTIDQKFSGTPDGYSFGASFSGYKSVFRSNGYRTFGYLCGGEKPGNSTTSFVGKIDFSDDTYSASTNLPSARMNSPIASSFNYGYVLGGGSSPNINSRSAGCIKIDFSNDNTNDLNDLPFSRRDGGCISDTENAYISGGSFNAPFTQSAITRFNFSTDTSSDTGFKIHDVDYRGSAGVSDGKYGYFIGGFDPSNPHPPNFFASFSTKTKLDFSAETLSTLSPFGRYISRSTVVQDNLYGFYMSNSSGPVVDNSPPNPSYNPDTYRLDFSTGVTSNTGVQTFDGPWTLQPGGAVSGNHNGYILGGSPGQTTSGYKFDYKNHTKTELPALLPIGLDSSDGIANSAISTN